jgi:hypothetical protein
MESTMTWPLIAAGSVLLLMTAVGRLVWPRLRFWLALTRATIDREMDLTEEQAFQSSLQIMATRTARRRGLASPAVEPPQMDQSVAREKTLVG